MLFSVKDTFAFNSIVESFYRSEDSERFLVFTQITSTNEITRLLFNRYA